MEHTQGFLSIVNDAKSRIRQIEIGQYKKMVADAEPHRLIDVREESEFAAGHAAGAMHLSKGLIERDIERPIPDKDPTLVLHCVAGYPSPPAPHNTPKLT